MRRQLRKLIPAQLLKNYREFKSYSWRVKILEAEIKNRWLSERLSKPKNQKEILRLKEFKIYSQNGEDGILDYIFSKIGVKNKKFIEFGIQDGKECNTANLSINK